MGAVVAQAVMSLDGYIAEDDHTIGRLFDWYSAGEVEVPTAKEEITLRLTPASAAYVRGWLGELGALVCGRRLFDVVGGWDGRHPLDVPVVVLTHHPPEGWRPEAPFTFVTDGVAAAVARAQELAGTRTVAVTAGVVAAQCLQAGLLDEVAVDLVPVVMGTGRRFFPDLPASAILLGDPTVCIPSTRVTHLRMPVLRPAG